VSVALGVSLALGVVPAQAHATLDVTSAGETAALESFVPADETWLPPFPYGEKRYTRYVINDTMVDSSLVRGSSVVMGEERVPIEGSPNNANHVYCDSYGHPGCTGRAVFFHNQLPVCASDGDWNCIRSVTASGPYAEGEAIFVRGLDVTGALDPSLLGTTSGGNVYTGVHPVTTFPGDVARDLPPGGTVSLWALPGLPSDSLLAVSVVMMGDTPDPNGPARLQTFSASIVPVLARPRATDFAPALLEVEERDGRLGVGSWGGLADGCIYADMKFCYVRAQFPAGLRLSLSANLTNTLTGWLHGRLADPMVDIEPIDSRTNLVRIEGDTVELPVGYRDFVYEELPPEFRDNPSHNLSSTWTLFAEGEYRMNWFEVVLPYMGERAAANLSAWSVRSVASWELPDCLQSRSELVGLVTTNAMMYNGGPPRLVKGRLTYRVGGLHENPDGSAKRGSYSLVMRASAARCVYGLGKLPFSAEISVTSQDGVEQVASTSVAQRDGWLRLTAENFTFSVPTISIRLTQKKPRPATLTCVKTNPSVAGPKRIVVKGSPGHALKCPRGYRPV
jgi:hypothetical protein